MLYDNRISCNKNVCVTKVVIPQKAMCDRELMWDEIVMYDISYIATNLLVTKAS